MLKSNAVLVGASLLTLALLVGAAWRYDQLTRPQASLTEARVHELLNDFRSQSSQLFSLEAQNNWKTEFAEEFTDPRSILPDPDRYDRTALTSLLKQGESCKLPRAIKKDAQERKFQAWFDFKCRGTELPAWVWQKPPLQHPLGGSWAHWLFKNGFQSAEWLAENRSVLHPLERRDLPEQTKSNLDRIFGDLSPMEFQQLISGSWLVVSSSYVAITSYVGPDKSILAIYARSDWDRHLLQAELQVRPFGSTQCEIAAKSHCWSRTDTGPTGDPRNALALMLLAAVVQIGILGFSIWLRFSGERAMRENQSLVMQTLAHELRHPVTGLKMSVETLRDRYDEFDDEFKKEFLRLMGISARMDRLVRTSQQYLRLLSNDRIFAFQKEPIESVHSFVEAVFEEYRDRIQIENVEHDCGAHFDHYWVATCLRNLVVNALHHGQRPVVVRWKRQNADILFEVEDAGKGSELSLSELTRPKIKRSEGGGMGLGLSLVARLAHLMGGTLKMYNNPTRFVLTLSGVARANLAVD